MGKITRYHPVSLHVVRGAAEYCGFKFGRLKQVTSNQTGSYAIYRAQIVTIPEHCKDKSLKYIRFALTECFNADIRVEMVKQSTKAGLSCVLRTSIVKDPETLLLPEPEMAPIQGGGGGGGGGPSLDEFASERGRAAQRVRMYEIFLHAVIEQRDALLASDDTDENDELLLRRSGHLIRALKTVLKDESDYFDYLLSQAYQS